MKEAEAGSEPKARNEDNSKTEAEAGNGEETGAGNEVDNAAETETETENLVKAETEAENIARAEAGTEAETEMETVPESEAQIGNEAEAVTEIVAQSQAENAAGTKNEAENVVEYVSEAKANTKETTAESEARGENSVESKGQAENVAEGEAKNEAQAKIETEAKKDTGERPRTLEEERRLLHGIMVMLGLYLVVPHAIPLMRPNEPNQVIESIWTTPFRDEGLAGQPVATIPSDEPDEEYYDGYAGQLVAMYYDSPNSLSPATPSFDGSNEPNGDYTGQRVGMSTDGINEGKYGFMRQPLPRCSAVNADEPNQVTNEIRRVTISIVSLSEFTITPQPVKNVSFDSDLIVRNLRTELEQYYDIEAHMDINPETHAAYRLRLSISDHYHVTALALESMENMIVEIHSSEQNMTPPRNRRRRSSNVNETPKNCATKTNLAITSENKSTRVTPAKETAKKQTRKRNPAKKPKQKQRKRK